MAFRWIFVPVLLGLGIIRWFLDGMAFVTMSRHNSLASVRLVRSAVIRLEGNFVAAIVPVLIGTISMHTYLLHKEKLRLSESMAITTLRVILPVFLFLLNIPILFYMRTDPLSGKFFAQFIKIVSLPVVVIIGFFILTLFYPHQIKRMASAMIRWWGRIKFLHIERILDLEERFFHGIDQFSKIFWAYLRKRKRILLGSAGWILAAFMADYFIALAILWGFGYQPSIVRALAVQFLIRPIIYMAPTPGGAGIWEFTYLGFFSLFMSNNLIGVAVLFWRILVTYLPCIAGAFFLTREFHRDDKLREIMLEKGELPEEGLENIEEQNGI